MHDETLLPHHDFSFLGRRGFSLLELMVVLLLLAIIAGISAPATGRFLDNLAVRRQTSSVLSAFRYARLLAISSGHQVEVSLSEDHPGSLILKGKTTETRPVDIDTETSLALSPESITFFPEGQASPAEILLVRGDRVKRFLIDPLTALPVREYEK